MDLSRELPYKIPTLPTPSGVRNKYRKIAIAPAGIGRYSAVEYAGSGMPQTTLLVFRKASGSAPLEDWLNELEQLEPKAHAKCLAFIQRLEQSGFDLRRPTADILEDGIYELRPKHGNVNYRILYFFIGRNLACLSHGFTKEGKVPEQEIERAKDNRVLVKSNRAKYTKDMWEV